LEKAAAPLALVKMANFMDHGQDRGEITRWFIYDGHFSDYGARIYARAIHKYLVSDWIKGYLSSRAAVLPRG
jgi:hypothetical protein